MEISKINNQQNFTAVIANKNLVKKQRAIYKKLESYFELATKANDNCDLFVGRSSNSYVHTRSGRYEHCAHMQIVKDGVIIAEKKDIPNSTRAWIKNFNELVKSTIHSDIVMDALKANK